MTAEQPPARTTYGPVDVVRGLVLLVLGLLVSWVCVTTIPVGPRAGGHLLSLGAALAVVVTPLAVRLALRAVPRFGGVVLLAGWVAVAIFFSGRSSNGSVVLPGGGGLAVPVYVYVVGGFGAGVLAALVRTGR